MIMPNQANPVASRVQSGNIYAMVSVQLITQYLLAHSIPDFKALASGMIYIQNIRSRNRVYTRVPFFSFRY